MNVTRRDLLKLAGGSALGILFTPVPWKLLDDSSIWTQNWSLIPQLQHGPITYRYTTCALCPGGCGIKARCVSGNPVSLAGIPNHPVSKGVLCPIGLTGHHLSYHPLRLTEPQTFSNREQSGKLIPGSFDTIIAEVAKNLPANGNEAIAVLDQRPGRSLSRIYREFLQRFPKSYYIVPPSWEDSTLVTIQTMMVLPSASMGFDFENARTVLSFGAPLLDNWGTPGRMISDKQNGLVLIQAESRQSRTALQAETWLPLRPGTEATLALGIANVILGEKLYTPGIEKNITDFAAFSDAASRFTPKIVSEITGLEEVAIVETARTIARSPSIILAGCDPGGGPLDKASGVAIAALNILCGNVGRQGGIVFRYEMPGTRNHMPAPVALADVPDHSVKVLIVDAAESGYTFPSSLIRQKLVPGKGIVVSLSPYLSALSAEAHYLVPAPAHLESMEEVMTPDGASTSSLSLSTPLSPKGEKTVEPVEFIKKLSDAAGVTGLAIPATEAMLKERVKAIHASKRGMVFSHDGKTVKIADLGSADDVWTSLTNGGCWMDEPMEQKVKSRFSLFGSGPQLKERLVARAAQKEAFTLTLVPFGWRGAGNTVSPVMSKLFQESDLRNLAGRAFINPATAASYSLAEGETAQLRTQNGEIPVAVHLDDAVMPGVIYGAVGPSPNKSETAEHMNGDGILALCTVTDDGTWRTTEATIRKQ